MAREEIIRVYNLARIFVRKYQPQYYYQYRGQVEDLASEYFTYFVANEGKVSGKTLIEAYDPTKVSLEYYVKVCVIRKLIDDSRSDNGLSDLLSELSEDSASYLEKHAVISDEPIVDDRKFTDLDIKRLRDSYIALPKKERSDISELYAERRNVFAARGYVDMFDKVIPPPVRKRRCGVKVFTFAALTPDYLKLRDSEGKLYSFGRFDGEQYFSRNPYFLNMEEMDYFTREDVVYD